MKKTSLVDGRIFITIKFVFPIILGIFLVSCSGDDNGRSGNNNERLIPAVEAVRARSGSLPLTERLSGIVRAKNQVELYPQISAPIVSVHVENGDVVQSGKLLVQLRDTEFREDLKQAEANYQIAIAQAKQAEAEWQRMRKEFERAESLSEKDLISQTEFETIETEAVAAEANAELARARVNQTQAIVEQRKEELSRTAIRAPVDGTVGNRNAEVGMLVMPGTRLFTLGQLDSMRVEVILSDLMLTYIKENQRSEIFSRTLPFGSITAPVARISPFLHPVTHSTKAEIDLANTGGELKPGMFVAVDIFYGESEQATLVPLSTLWESPATAEVGVFVCRDSVTMEPFPATGATAGGALTNPLTFEFVPVDVIAKGRMNAGVRGIDEGEWIVTIGQELFGADSGMARVRPVAWERVEEMQKLQREDLLEEIIQRQQEQVEPADSALIGRWTEKHEDAS